MAIELSYVTIDCGNDISKILYLNPMRDSNGRYKTAQEWVKEIVGYHVQYWYGSTEEDIAWMYNSIYDSLRKAIDLCQYLYETVIEDLELIDLRIEFVDLILGSNFPDRIKDLVK